MCSSNVSLFASAYGFIYLFLFIWKTFFVLEMSLIFICSIVVVKSFAVERQTLHTILPNINLALIRQDEQSQSFLAEEKTVRAHGS